MSKVLVTYFSASGVTAKVAGRLAEADTFLEAYDFSGKKIIPFCTSGSSGLGDTAKRMQEIAVNGTVLEGKRFEANVSVNEMKTWADSLGL